MALMIPKSNIPRALQLMVRPSSSKAAATVPDETKNLVIYFTTHQKSPCLKTSFLTYFSTTRT